jgi:hypothetical protein
MFGMLPGLIFGFYFPPINMFFVCLLFCRKLEYYFKKKRRKEGYYCSGILYSQSFILICSIFIFQRHTREGILVVKDFLYSLDLFLIKFKKLGESHVWNITDSKASFMRVSEQDNYPIIQQRPRKK